MSATIAQDRYRELAARVRLLSWLSLGVMSVEGVVALVAGVMAGSIALVGFGLDSAIEGFASVIIIWRFTGSRVLSQAAEHRAQKLVAIQFFILAPYVSFESVRALAGGEHPEVSVLGMALAVFSLVTMPLLGIAKQRIAEQIGSAATKGEGRQNVLCAYLAGALLIGLAGNAIAGAWWLDPAVGLLIAAVAVKEGLEAWRGEGCCVGSPLDGYAAEVASSASSATTPRGTATTGTGACWTILAEREPRNTRAIGPIELEPTTSTSPSVHSTSSSASSQLSPRPTTASQSSGTDGSSRTRSSTSCCAA